MKKYYILVGDEKTWQYAFKDNIWGFSPKTKGLWKTTFPGDIFAFYVIRPVKKIIGFGRLIEKFESHSLYWPDELLFKKIMWPFRLQLEIIHIIDNWEEGISIPSTFILNQGRKKVNESDFSKFVKNAEDKWKIRIPKILTM